MTKIATQLLKPVRAPRGVTALNLDILVFLCANSRDDEVAQYEALVGDWHPVTAASWLWHRGGVRAALLDNLGSPICAGGWYPVEEGIYQPWMVGTQAGWDYHWRDVHQFARWMTEQVMAHPAGLRRLQMMAPLSRPGALAWYERLGLEREAVLRRYARNGEDVALHARILDPES